MSLRPVHDMTPVAATRFTSYLAAGLLFVQTVSAMERGPLILGGVLFVLPGAPAGWW